MQSQRVDTADRHPWLHRAQHRPPLARNKHQHLDDQNHNSNVCGGARAPSAAVGAASSPRSPVRDTGDARDTVGKLFRRGLVRGTTDEATQLNHAGVRSHFDLVRRRARIADQRRSHPASASPLGARAPPQVVLR